MIEKTIKIKKEKEGRKQGEKNNTLKLCFQKVTSGAKYLGEPFHERKINIRKRRS